MSEDKIRKNLLKRLKEFSSTRDLTDAQKYIIGRICAELTMIEVGGRSNINDGVYELTKDLLKGGAR